MNKIFKGIREKTVRVVPLVELERMKQQDEEKEVQRMKTRSGDLSAYEDNPYHREFLSMAKKRRRENPAEYSTDFDAEASVARDFPELYASAWSRTWEEAFIEAVSYEHRWNGAPLDAAYQRVASKMPEGSKAIALSQCRRW